jgi:hypothetical protein
MTTAAVAPPARQAKLLTGFVAISPQAAAHCPMPVCGPLASELLHRSVVAIPPLFAIAQSSNSSNCTDERGGFP